jgi:sulfur-carrier protein adenylyltransferase/sulfurtransferase
VRHRYSRQINLAEIGETGQQKLLDAKVLVIGAGGLGCPVLTYLASMGIGTIGICDYDKIDITNLHRQPMYGTDDVGKFKALIAAQKINQLNNDVSVDVFLEKLTLDSGKEIFNDYDLVIDCSDNFKTKFLIHDLCNFFSLNLVQASIYQYDGTLNVYRFKDKENNPCMRCLWPIRPEEGCVGDCTIAGVLGVVPGVLGTMQAAEAVKLLLGLPGLESGKSLLVDLISMSTHLVGASISSDCPCCHTQMSEKLLDFLSKDTPEDFEISMQQLSCPSEYVWIDIRSNEEIKNRPLRLDLEIRKYQESFKFDEKSQYLFFCQKGKRSKKLVQDLRNKGINAYSLIGGVEQC